MMLIALSLNVMTVGAIHHCLPAVNFYVIIFINQN